MDKIEVKDGNAVIDSWAMNNLLRDSGLEEAQQRKLALLWEDHKRIKGELDTLKCLVKALRSPY